MDEILSPRSVTRTKQKTKGRRKFPISHPGDDVILCNKCSQFSAKFTIPPPSNDSGDENKIHSELTDEDLIRQMSSGKFWKSNVGWCEKCMETLNQNKPTVAQLFGVLRQWTPQAQLQLATIVQEFFRCGANINDRDSVTDMTLLHYVAKCGALGDEEIAAQIAELLIKHGAEVESRCSWTDMTPLHFAAYFDCPLLVQLLLDHNANLLSRSSHHDGATALHLAASNLSLAAAKIILQSESLKPEIELRNIKDNFGRTPNDCLPPAGQLPEPLSNIRDRLAELLKYSTSHRHPLYSDQTLENFDHIEDEFKRFSFKCEKDQLGEHDKLNTIPRMNKSNRNDGLEDELNSRFADTFDQILNPNFTPAPVVYTHTPGTAETGTLIARSRRSSSLAPASGQRNNLPPMRKFIDDVDENHLKLPINANEKKSNDPTKLGNQQTEQKYTNSSSKRSSKSVTPDMRKRSRGSLFKPTKPPPQSMVSAKVTLQSLGLNIGDKVCVGPATASIDKTETDIKDINGRMGKLKYCGPVEFATGIWVGVELDEPLGRNNGSVLGVSYFSCQPKYGIFAPIGRVYKLDKNSCWHSIGTPSNISTEKYVNTEALKNEPVDVSHVTAKVDTGLKKKPSMTSQEAQLIQVSDHVLVANLKKGIVRFIGETSFAPGIWYGIELFKPHGKNDGSVGGVPYFKCPPNHGIFSPLKRIQKIHGDIEDTEDESSSVLNTKMTHSYHESISDNENSSMDRRSLLSDRITRCSSAINSPKTIPTKSAFKAKNNKFVLEIDMNVLCAGEMGILKYIGPVTFTDGVWLGIELRKPCGRHDGQVAEKRYFHCRPNHGVLVRPSRVTCRGVSATLLLPPEMLELEKSTNTN